MESNLKSSAQLALATAEATPALPGWLTPSDGAAILGLSARHIIRMCAGGTLAARQVDGAWLIDPLCRSEFRVAAGATDVPVLADSSLAGLTAAKRGIIARRYRILKAWRAAAATRPATKTLAAFTRDWLLVWNKVNPHLAVSASTLWLWQQALGAEGIAGLIDHRHKTDRASASPEAWKVFESLYLSQAKPAVPPIYEHVAGLAVTEGWDWPSLATVQRWTRVRLDPKLAALGRDPKRFRDRCIPHVRRDWTRVAAMELWVADHRQFDVLLPRQVPSRKGGMEWRWYRPWLTMFLDARSWMPAARTIRFESPNGNCVMATFCRGVLQHGQPEQVYLDNGKDFRMQRFAGGRKLPSRKGEQIVPARQVQPILDLLGIGSSFAIPYNAKAKIVEPWFKLLAERFDKTWATYCGRNAQERPEQLRALDGKAAEYAAKGYTLEAFQTAFDAWITGDYGLRKSPFEAAGGLSPARAFVELRRPGFRPVRPAAEDLALLLMKSVRVKVEQNGIYVRAFGQYYWSDALEDRRCGSGRDLRRKVRYSLDEANPAFIYVWDGQSEKFLCTATPYVGEAIHPLAKTSGDDSEVDRLADAIALQRSSARRTRQELTALQKFAGNILLAGRNESAFILGKFDAPSTIPVPPPPVIKLTGQVTVAAQAGLETTEQQRRTQSAREFFNRQKTGTDSDQAQQGPAPDAMEFLAARSELDHEHEDLSDKQPDAS